MGQEARQLGIDPLMGATENTFWEKTAQVQIWVLGGQKFWTSRLWLPRLDLGAVTETALFSNEVYGDKNSPVKYADDSGEE